MDAILTNYPLSREFQEGLAALVATGALKLSVGELRQQPALKMLKYLRSLTIDQLFLPVEDENGSALLPVLKVLASVVPARRIYLVDKELRSHRISRLEAVGSVLQVILASLAARAAVLRAQREISALLKTDRSLVADPQQRNVLYLNANLWFGLKAGGSVGHISGVVNGLMQKGCTVEFVSAGGRLMVNDRAKYQQLEPPQHFGFPWELNYYRFHFDVVNQVERIAKRPDFDFIYQRLSLGNYSGVVWSRRLGIPLVLEYNGSEAWIARNWGRPLREHELAERVEEANLRHAHLIVTISDVLRDELLQRGVAPQRIMTYPNCIDPEMFDPARFSAEQIAALRQRHGISSDAVVVAFVGTFGQWHGAEVLAQAIQVLLEENLEWADANKVHFLLIGDGLRMPEVRRILGKHAEGPYVTLAGLVPQHEAPLYLAASDILSSPHVPNADGTPFFGSPTKLFEYMAMGKAIVASDLDQIGVVLANCVRADQLLAQDAPEAGDTRLAVLCKPGSVTEHMNAIRFLVSNPHWRVHLGRRARMEALSRYTWSHHVEQILSALKHCG